MAAKNTTRHKHESDMVRSPFCGFLRSLWPFPIPIFIRGGQVQIPRCKNARAADDDGDLAVEAEARSQVLLRIHFWNSGLEENGTTDVTNEYG